MIADAEFLYKRLYVRLSEQTAKLRDCLDAFKSALCFALMRPWFMRPITALLRRFMPFTRIGSHTLVTRYVDVVEALSREGDFTVSQLNGPRIDRLDGPFVLGLDRGRQYNDELALLLQVVSQSDLKHIEQLVAARAAAQIAAARPAGRIDVVNAYARTVAVQVVAEYFGLRGPDDATMARWIRDIFHDIFLNLTDDRAVHARAARSAGELRMHADRVIAQRKTVPATGAPADVLGRMLVRKISCPWLDDDAIRRNLIGMIAATIDNTVTFLTLALVELLRRPAQFERARSAAVTGDDDTVRRYIYEAARFNPAAPMLARYARRDAVLAAGTSREHPVRAGTTLILGTSSAMFDPDGFNDPFSFDIDHAAERLHFGFSLHHCLGSHINGVQITQLAAALLRLPNVRLAPGSQGRVRFEGPFPNRLMLEFA